MAVEQGNRAHYDRTMLLALAGSPFAKVPPVKMAFIPGVTRTPNQSDVVMSFRKEKDRKKEKEKEKKTFNPFALLGDE
ncbi:uncharacterized protein B0P05DRAFT_635726 [Gilbertella persicaria]|uniref:uncharacterized protein n=1 Tax=Gilbertella persicaria TaxID=101096 RepID=UPI002220490A|nr:uncharacterized protein B0P05DRAFT_635726 [Gilbertella persicaria]KAI8085744.1 hypothetical protein B0P05DRAFT_635726 [Gilbertella persicaria]